MKRSEINELIRSASACFTKHGWALPPEPRWDVTDFALGDWRKFGLVLVNLAEENEYCEKLMYARKGMVTPAHCHRRKKEDIICRWGTLAVQIWSEVPPSNSVRSFKVPVNGKPSVFQDGDIITLNAGWRVTLVPGVYHEFQPVTEEGIIGEVSTANDDHDDNLFANSNVGRFPELIENEPLLLPLLSDK